MSYRQLIDRERMYRRLARWQEGHTMSCDALVREYQTKADRCHRAAMKLQGEQS